jgi:hypothetical protein
MLHMLQKEPHSLILMSSKTPIYVPVSKIFDAFITPNPLFIMVPLELFHSRRSVYYYLKPRPYKILWTHLHWVIGFKILQTEQIIDIQSYNICLRFCFVVLFLNLWLENEKEYIVLFYYTNDTSMQCVPFGNCNVFSWVCMSES